MREPDEQSSAGWPLAWRGAPCGHRTEWQFWPCTGAGGMAGTGGFVGAWTHAAGLAVPCVTGTRVVRHRPGPGHRDDVNLTSPLLALQSAHLPESILKPVPGKKSDTSIPPVPSGAGLGLASARGS